jgi:hypothetical protein
LKIREAKAEYNLTNGNALGGQSKSWITPQNFKSCMKTQNNITALSLSEPVIARSAAQSKI